jgi:uncharacterized membrane protein
MQLLPEKDYRQLFRIGILVKAVDGLIEACAGVYFYFAGYTTINRIFFSVFHGEIAESPRDAFWQFFINQWHAISLSSNAFWGLLFFAHGAIKLALSVALLKNYLWAYPTAAVIFTLFVGYEIYSLTNHPSLFLWCITIFDALVVGLILHEYRHIKKRHALL